MRESCQHVSEKSWDEKTRDFKELKNADKKIVKNFPKIGLSKKKKCLISGK